MPDTAGLAETAADEALSAWASESLASIDADPRFYTTVAADDLDEVRAALGYETIDLYGTSYGGTLVQYYLRQHGEHVRVAVLDGSTPVDVPVFERMAASSQAALDLFRRCAEDNSCHEAFPHLADEWVAPLDRLATPLKVVDPESGDEAVIDQIGLAEAIHTALLTKSTAAQIPLAVHLAYQERWVKAAQLIGVEPPGCPILLMADEIFCSEAWARDEPAEVARQGVGSYALARELAKAKQRATMCEYLPQGVVPEDDAAGVRTDTPYCGWWQMQIRKIPQPTWRTCRPSRPTATSWSCLPSGTSSAISGVCRLSSQPSWTPAAPTGWTPRVSLTARRPCPSAWNEASGGNPSVGKLGGSVRETVPQGCTQGSIGWLPNGRAPWDIRPCRSRRRAATVEA